MAYNNKVYFSLILLDLDRLTEAPPHIFPLRDQTSGRCLYVEYADLVTKEKEKEWSHWTALRLWKLLLQHVVCGTSAYISLARGSHVTNDISKATLGSWQLAVGSWQLRGSSSYHYATWELSSRHRQRRKGVNILEPLLVLLVDFNWTHSFFSVQTLETNSTRAKSRRKGIMELGLCIKKLVN